MKALKLMRIGRLAAFALTAGTLNVCMAQAEPPQTQTTPGISMQASAPQTGSTTRHRLPIIRNSNGLSLNWSGYAVSASDVTSVSATFTVPEIGPPGSIGGLTPDFSAATHQGQSSRPASPAVGTIRQVRQPTAPGGRCTRAFPQLSGA